MKKKRISVEAFHIGAIAVALIVFLFIFSALSIIVLKGFPCIREAFQSSEIFFAIKLSLYTTSVSTLICILLAIPTAYALTKTAMPCKKLVQMILELPLSLPHLVLGLSLLMLFSTPFGKFLSALGFKVIFSVNGIILAHIFVNLPFAIRIIRNGFYEVNPKLEWIAGLLGASRMKVFQTVTLPLAKNIVIGAVILTWSRALGEFGATLMLVGATRMKTETIPTSIYLNMATGDTDSTMAVALVLLLISALSYALSNFFAEKSSCAGQNTEGG